MNPSQFSRMAPILVLLLVWFTADRAAAQQETPLLKGGVEVDVTTQGRLNAEQTRYENIVKNIDDNERDEEVNYKRRLADLENDKRFSPDVKAARRASIMQDHENSKKALARNRALEEKVHAQEIAKILGNAERRSPTPPRNRPPTGNLDPGKGPLQGFVTNDEEVEEPRSLDRQLRALDDFIESVPGLPAALRAGARFTGEQRRELERAYDPTKPGMASRILWDTLSGEAGSFVPALRAAGRPAAAAVDDALKPAAAAVDDTVKSLETAAETVAGEVRDGLQKAIKEILEAEKSQPLDRLPRELNPTRFDNARARAANPSVNKALYWAWVAENQRLEPDKVITQILQDHGLSGKALEITRQVVLDNVVSARKWGLFDHPGNLARLRAGRSAYSPILGDRIDVIHTIPVNLPKELLEQLPADHREKVIQDAMRFSNQMMNLRIGPRKPNIMAGNSINDTRIRWASDYHEAGAISELLRDVVSGKYRAESSRIPIPKASVPK